MIQFIVFSRARPLQLEGYLRSLYEHCYGEIEVSVLIKIDEPYRAAYEQVMGMFPSVVFVEQSSFQHDLRPLVFGSISEHVCFGCDDVLFVRYFNPDAAEWFLERHPEVIAVSLWRGQSLKYGLYPEQPIALPSFTEDRSFVSWDMTGREGLDDWGYAWDILGSIYRRSFVRALWPDLSAAPNPSLFETYGASAWPVLTEQRSFACWKQPRAINPTVNVVGIGTTAGVVGEPQLTPDALLTCWNAGFRMDVERFAQQHYNSWRVPDFYLCRDVAAMRYAMVTASA